MHTRTKKHAELEMFVKTLAAKGAVRNANNVGFGKAGCYCASIELEALAAGSEKLSWWFWLAPSH